VSAGDLGRRELAALVDHTLLAPEATDAQVVELCEEAIALDVCAACVTASRVPAAARALAGSAVRLAAVVGFPSGAHRAATKADEAARAVFDGADELDLVIDLGHAAEGRWDAVGAEVTAVRAAVEPGVTLKVIIESALLDGTGIEAACHACEGGGADFVKTSTGFHPAGGASRDAVARIAEVVAPRLGVKAAGGIRTAETALAFVRAGATRLGMSRTAQVLDELAGG
jgi:deoxyribose-phosphate aldolase